MPPRSPAEPGPPDRSPAKSSTEQIGQRPGGWFNSGAGEMASLIASKDWSQTPLGPLESWPQSLRTTVSLCLDSNFPIAIIWGPDRIQLYNDSYRQICAAKHPHSLGQDFRECWFSAWPAIGEIFENATAGQTGYLTSQRMFLDRFGYLEETFFTFSFSPIRDETGNVGGLFHPVTEVTQQLLSDRRRCVLRDLAHDAAEPKSVEDSLARLATTLSENPLDVPFALFYTIDGSQARLVSSTGVKRDTTISPERIDLRVPTASGWPLLSGTNPTEIEDLIGRFGSFACEPYPEAPRSALVLPISIPGRPQLFLIAGVSARRPLDESYRAFYDLLGAAITGVLATASAFEDERRRTEALTEIDRVKTAFFANISHEFRTPLTLILGPTEDALASANPALSGEALELVHRNALRLMKLVNALLEFARMESGRAEASYEPSDLAALTIDLASSFRSAIERTGLAFTVDCQALPEPIYVDRDLWEKILLNLLSNALKFTFTGSIEVSLQWCGDHAELLVRDTGTGIPEDELPNLFKRFHRIQGAKSRTHEGSGIGLALVQDLVHLHGGTIEVASRLGEGTTFKISLRQGSTHLPAQSLASPRSTQRTNRAAEPFIAETLRWSDSRNRRPIATVAPAPDTERKDLQILVVDDNADLRDYAVSLLESAYRVETAVDGVEALKAARRDKPALILSDVMMPNLDGFGLLRAIRADSALRDIPVLLLSARAGEESTVEGLSVGADDYLVKPFAARELLARVRTHLELARQRDALARAKDAAELANRELSSFSYSVAHDLRAPLRSIDGFSKILLEDYGSQLDALGCKHLDRIRNSSQRMAQLIDDLLALSRITQSELLREKVDLSALARVAIDRQKATQPERQVEVVIQEGLISEGDPRLLMVALENLLGNAWKFTRKQPRARIEFASTLDHGHRVYFVRDNGAGFDMTYASKLFGVFQRLHPDEEFEGTGIGLATAQRVISRHQGQIWAEGAVGRGAIFSFRLSEKTPVS